MLHKIIRESFSECTKNDTLIEPKLNSANDPQGGGTQHIRIRGGQSKKFSGNPKISLQLQCNPKRSAFLYI